MNEQPTLWTGGNLRGTKTGLIAKIEASGLSAGQKAGVLEALNAVPDEVELISLHYNNNAPAGILANYGCTIQPIN